MPLTLNKPTEGDTDWAVEVNANWTAIEDEFDTSTGHNHDGSNSRKVLTSLDEAYDKGGSGAGRTITADSGAVVISGAVTNGGLEAASTSGAGLKGTSTSSYGVRGESTSGNGVSGESTSNNGVAGVSTAGIGVRAISTSSYGLYATSTDGWGGYVGSTSGYGLQCVCPHGVWRARL